MKGTTNALVYRGGGTSLIYAYNGEESGWSAGEKAYISNRLRTQEGRQHLETPSKTYSASTAFYGKTMLIYSRYSTGHIYPAFCKTGLLPSGGAWGTLPAGIFWRITALSTAKCLPAGAGRTHALT